MEKLPSVTGYFKKPVEINRGIGRVPLGKITFSKKWPKWPGNPVYIKLGDCKMLLTSLPFKNIQLFFCGMPQKWVKIKTQKSEKVNILKNPSSKHYVFFGLGAEFVVPFSYRFRSLALKSSTFLSENIIIWVKLRLRLKVLSARECIN